MHLEIEKLGGNALFLTVVEPLRSRTDRLNVANMHTDPVARHREHVALVDAIAQGDTELASAVAFSHVQWGRERILHTLEHVPGYDPDH